MHGQKATPVIFGVRRLTIEDFPDQKLSLRRRELIGYHSVVDPQAINRSCIARYFVLNTDLPKHEGRLRAAVGRCQQADMGRWKRCEKTPSRGLWLKSPAFSV